VVPEQRTYPWQVWTDGKIHTISSEVHYDCKLESMRLQLHLRAKRSEMKVWTRTHRTRNSTTTGLTFQFYTGDSPPLPASDRL